MSQQNWSNALATIKPYIYKIFTQDGSGTGFVISYHQNGNLCGVATAYHVVKNAHEWKQPIKLLHNDSQKLFVLEHNERAIFVYPDKDLAFILFNDKETDIKSALPALVPFDKFVKQGIEVGWCGFPSVAPHQLCFFAGYVSCFFNATSSYLIDGVAINGVSGGPVFHVNSTNQKVYICGVVSAYIPNKVNGDTLPGVCYVTSTSTYHPLLESLVTLSQAKKKAEEQNKSITTDLKKGKDIS